ncbi:DUF4458 domain-containing protein [uncultured Bacteroides sp.]|uniref:DUF4458 domain-containing protein n=1 Tax=uncultured Bacteroides sp. TaxID=162156 RepID=UPI00261B3B99|nr:DUF4458 domain-containing protein [uncultured Bacteroides sp.]
MKLKKLNILNIYLLLLFIVGCTDESYNLEGGSGYVQFKIYKGASYSEQRVSRAGINQLDFLNDAKKIKILLSNDQFNFSQTLNLNSYNEENAEFGLRSDKLELQPGEYTIDGYYLYGKTENQLFAGQPSEKTIFKVESGTLIVQDLLADAVGRGTVQFRLVKNIIDSRAATSNEDSYPLSSIYKVNITVKNTETNRSQTFQDLEVEYKEDFSGSGNGNRTSFCEIDSLLVIETGTYQITSYEAKDRNKTIQYFNDVVLKETKFTVYDNQKTEADVPVNLIKSAENILDYVALKAIWEAMGGPNWSYNGQSYPKGVNWSFDDKDIDMWGDQPGVGLDNNGRVISLNLGEFGATGKVPAAIGELSELQTLMLGTHNDLLGYGGTDNQSALTSLKGELTSDRLAKIRSDYMDNFVSHDLRDELSDPLKMALEIKGEYKRKVERKGISPKDVNWGDLTNGITGIDPAIGKLKKLEVLYIANAPITSLPEATPGNDEEPGIAGLEALTDLEIYNCPEMKIFPSVIAQLPELIQLNMAMNKQLTSEEFNKGLKELAEGESKEKIQIMYLGYNNISELPTAISGMKKLGKIDLIYNKLKKLPAFGKNVNLVQANFDYNEIDEIGVDANELFCGMDDVESISFSHNKLKKLPNIFDPKSIYIMASVSFAYNEIDDEGMEDFEGINTTNLSLAGNKLKRFPYQLFKFDSPLTVLNLSANQIETFKKGDLTGKNTYMLTTLDLTYNRLTELPSDFDGKTLPFLYGLDISGNQLKAFPWGAANISYLTVLALRNQRDNDGNRVYSEWPTSIYQHIGLRALFLGGNDIGKVPETETISYLINTLDVSDNPNIILNVSDVCPYIKAGIYTLIYDTTQDIRGCDALELE